MSIFKRNRASVLHEENRLDNWAYFWMALFMVGGYALFSLVSGFFGIEVLRWFAVAIIVILLVSLEYSAWKQTTNEKKIVHVILFVAIIMRLYYMIATAQPEYSGETIEIIKQMQEDLTLPDVAQPLFYVISAVLSYAASLVGITASAPMEIVRLVNEYFGVVCVIVIYYILCELEANDTAIYLGACVIAFYPGLIIAGGRLTSTMLLTMLLMFTILYLVRWNNYTDGYNFILMSLCFGLAVMTDMRAFVFAPVIAVLIVVNLVRVIKRKQAVNTVSTVLRTVIGLAIWGVLSFAYPVRNMMAGKSTGMLDLMSDMAANGGKSNVGEKLFSFSAVEMLNVFADKENDKNAWAYFIKTSMFGDSSSNTLTLNIMRVFICISAAFLVTMAFMEIVSIFSKMDIKLKQNILTMAALCLSAIIYYILLNIGRPSAESMEFENIAVILASGTALLASGMKVLSNKKKLSFGAGILYVIMLAVGFAFCICSVAYYMIIFA